jgi:hypothetical protein
MEVILLARFSCSCGSHGMTVLTLLGLHLLIFLQFVSFLFCFFLLDFDCEEKDVFVESLRFERWKKLKFKIGVIQLKQMVKMELALLNLLALSEIEASCCPVHEYFHTFIILINYQFDFYEDNSSFE